MTATTESAPRIVTLDVIRGVAVMGILAMNIVAFAMPFEAYMNPLAYGTESAADLISWFVSFVFIDGKMRGLFSFLFGASMLLVIERAAAAGGSPERVHFRRMAWLLLFGLAHLYFIWFGDILSLYAPIGMVAWFFHAKSARALVRWGVAFVLLQFLIFIVLGLALHAASAAASAPDASQQAMQAWREVSADFATPSAEELARDLAVHQGSYSGLVAWRLQQHLWLPLSSFFFFGSETLGYMLLGMAGLKSGFLTGAWSPAAYRKVAGYGLAIAVPAYAILGSLLWSWSFGVLAIFDISMTAATLIRPVMITAIAAFIIIVTRNGGSFTARIAAAGRAAFTNYVGTSIVVASLFYGYGFGLYGELSRAELWLVVFGMWALMLLWSKPWLERFRYGPFEWLWRTLARWEIQPMRRPVAAA